MRTVPFAAATLATILAASAFGQINLDAVKAAAPKVPDAKETTLAATAQELLKSADVFTAAISQATTGKEVAAKIEAMNAKVTAGQKLLADLQTQYPALAQAKAPASVQGIQDTILKANAKVNAAVESIKTKYAGDATVAKAIETIQATLGGAKAKADEAAAPAEGAASKLSALAGAAKAAATPPAGDKYADFRAFMNDMIKSASDFATAVEKATTGKEAAAALSAMGKKLAAAKPQVAEFEKKYPELRQAQAPAELKDLQDASAQMGAKMNAAMTTLKTKYAQDPDVLKALDEFQKIRK